MIDECETETDTCEAETDTPVNAHIEQARAEAKQYRTDTGRPVDFHEEICESDDGTRNHSYSWRSREHSLRESVEIILKAGARAVREEDGVVRLQWPFPDPELETSDSERRRVHIEETAWPIRSREAACVVLDFLLEQGRHELPPRELKQIMMVLEGRALRNQEPIDVDDAADRYPVMQAVEWLMLERPHGWQGTATNLLRYLAGFCEQRGLKCLDDYRWPKDARSLSLQLRQAAQWLADDGIEYRRDRVADGRVVILRWLPGAKRAPQVAAAEATVPEDVETQAVGLADKAPAAEERPTVPSDVPADDEVVVEEAAEAIDLGDRDVAMSDEQAKVLNEWKRRRMTQDDAGILDFSEKVASSAAPVSS